MIGGNERRADEQQDDVCRVQALVNGFAPFLARVDVAVVPFGDDSLTPQQRKVCCERVA
jgi:hypothetical protein